jgi:hypothetical protein
MQPLLTDLTCLPHWCVRHTDGHAFATYTTRAPLFGVLREMDLLQPSIGEQLLVARQVDL